MARKRREGRLERSPSTAKRWPDAISADRDLLERLARYRRRLAAEDRDLSVSAFDAVTAQIVGGGPAPVPADGPLRRGFANTSGPKS
jgi:hypothetical protein